MVPANMMNVWEPQPSKPGDTVHWRIGPLDLWVKQEDEEWLVAVSRGEQERQALVDAEGPPDDLDWLRWAAHVTDSRIRVTPTLPDRSVIVRPSSPLQIPPRQEARFFVGVPIWVRLTVEPHTGKAVQIGEIAALPLSNSWFGTPTEGELCYALRTRAKRSLEELTPVPHRAVCSLLLRNNSEDTLDFQRLCLRARHLNIYEGARHLWTNEGKVAYKGEETLSEVAYGKGPPPFDGAKTRLAEARDKPERNFAFKTFDNLKAFASF